MAPLIASYLDRFFDKPLLIGPDSESRQWVEEIASTSGTPYAVADKQRHSDRDVEVKLVENDYRGRTVVIVDDIVSTGETMAAAARIARTRGAEEVVGMVIHALFCEGALEILQSAGASRIVSTDRIRHTTNEIPLAPLFPGAVS